MSNYFDNPDYPTNASLGNFAQHTYQGQSAYGGYNNFYYGGPAYGTVGTEPRRADIPMPGQSYGYPQQPYGMPQQQQPVPPQTQVPTGVGQMLSAPENGVSPYATYPPSGPAMGGFNQLMTDARRADINTTQSVGNNPWAQAPAPMPTAPMPTAPMPTAPMPAPTYQYQAPAYTGGGYGDAPAMYFTGGPNPFEKKPGMNMWDNLYSAPQPYVSPAPVAPAWTSGQVTPPTTQACYFPQQYPGMPAPAPQPQPVSWYEVSKGIWK